MVENNQKPIDSALLTATLKSLQVLQTIQQQQQTFAETMHKMSQADDSIATNLSTVKTHQDKLSNDMKQYHDDLFENQNANHQDTAKALAQIPEMMERLQYLSSSIDALDIKSQIEAQTELINQVVNGLKTQLHHTEDNLTQQIADSNSAENRVIISRLIDGLRNMNQNTQTVAQRIETLATCLSDFRKDTQVLSNNVANNNSRIESMDLRMGTIMTNDDEELSPESAIEMLTRIANENGNPSSTPEITHHIDDHHQDLENTPKLKAVQHHLAPNADSVSVKIATTKADTESEANQSTVSEHKDMDNVESQSNSNHVSTSNLDSDTDEHADMMKQVNQIKSLTERLGKSQDGDTHE